MVYTDPGGCLQFKEESSVTTQGVSVLDKWELLPLWSKSSGFVLAVVSGETVIPSFILERQPWVPQPIVHEYCSCTMSIFTM